MGELKTSRPFQERFLNGFDRSELRAEVQAVRPKQRFANLKKKGVSWALGASLALGGIGLPMKMMQSEQSGRGGAPGGQTASTPAPSGLNTEIARDLKTAQSIAQQVAGGVEAAVGGVGTAVAAPVKAAAEAPERLKVVTEQVRENFFKSEVPFGSIIYKEAKKNGVRPELVAAVVQAESRFKPTARSGAGAVGLMQLVPRTGKWMGARNLTDPAQNIAAGTKYLKYLNERFDGNETKVIAAYNAGEGNVRRFGGVPPFRETRSYVVKVRNYEKEFGERVEGRIAETQIASVDAR